MFLSYSFYFLAIVVIAELLLYSLFPVRLVALPLYDRQMRQALIGWVAVLRPQKWGHIHLAHHWALMLLMAAQRLSYHTHHADPGNVAICFDVLPLLNPPLGFQNLRFCLSSLFCLYGFALKICSYFCLFLCFLWVFTFLQLVEVFYVRILGIMEFQTSRPHKNTLLATC